MTAIARGRVPEVTEKALTAGGSAGYPLGAMGSMLSASGLLVSQSTAIKVAAVYAAVRIRSRDVARCTPSLRPASDPISGNAVTDHELAKLFRRPNRLQTWYEFAEQMHTAWLLRGNCYAVKLRNWRGEVVELIPVNPDLVQVLEAPGGTLFYMVGRQGMWMLAVLDGHPIAIPQEDVLHLRDLSFNTLLGISRLAAAHDAIGLALSQEQQAARWAGNGARPAGILQTAKTLTDEAALRLKTRWEQLQQGIQNVGRTAVLEDGVEWKPMQINSVDLEFLAQREFSVREIARFFDVPVHKLQETSQSTRASMAELNADYVQNTVMADLQRWEQKLAREFELEADNLCVQMDEDELLRADLKTMMDTARLGVVGGLLAQNEGRAMIGRGPKTGKEEGPDALLAPTNLAPNGSAVDGVAPDAAGRPLEGDTPPPKV